MIFLIERRLVAEKLKEFMIQQYITDNLSRVGHSHTKLQRTPLGEKIVVHASRPGLIVGKKGANIKRLTSTLKSKFGLENPQIEISEIEKIYLDANIVAETIAGSLERFGSQKFKGIGHKMMSEIMKAGAKGVEILLSGKVPSTRAKVWRFYQGYLKKCGDVAVSGVLTAYTQAKLKSGTVGIQVRIMPPDLIVDDIHLKTEEEKIAKEEKEKSKEKKEEEKKEKKNTKEKKKPAKKKPSKKKIGEPKLSNEGEKDLEKAGVLKKDEAK